MTPELSRPVSTDRIGPLCLRIAIEASPGELPAIAARLRLLGVAEMRCAFDLRQVGATMIEAAGTLTARVSETCVVSLDPFDHAVEERFTVHFVPSGTEDEDPEPDAIDQIPFDGSMIDLGEAAVEQLALALDPYPRKPGAALPPGFAAAPGGAFAALSALRRPG